MCPLTIKWVALFCSLCQSPDLFTLRVGFMRCYCSKILCRAMDAGSTPHGRAGIVPAPTALQDLPSIPTPLGHGQLGLMGPPHIRPYCLHLLYRPMKFSWPLLISLPTSGCCCSHCVCSQGFPHQPGGNDREVVQPGHGPNPPAPNMSFSCGPSTNEPERLLHQRTLWAFSVGGVCTTQVPSASYIAVLPQPHKEPSSG